VFYQARKKLLGVQNFVLKVINNNCPELKAQIEGPRRDKRVNLTVAVLVLPLVDGKIQVGEAFRAVTQELSVIGVGIVLDREIELNEVILGFLIEGDITFIHATAKHISPMEGGFYHLGLEMSEIIPADEYPELKLFKA
jgi:hypothetical protein